MIWPLLLGVAASGATLLGGYLTLRMERWIGTILGISAGAVLAVALLDLLPEAIRLSASTYGLRTVLALSAAGLLVSTTLHRMPESASGGRALVRRHLAPATLSLHSFLDGLGIGLAFQLSQSVGAMVAIAVLAHDLADGANTVILSLGRGNRSVASRWLAVNSAAPIAGVVLGQWLRLPPLLMGGALALVGGVFLHIGVVELLPRSYAVRPRVTTSLYSIAGAAFIYAVVSLSG